MEKRIIEEEKLSMFDIDIDESLGELLSFEKLESFITDAKEEGATHIRFDLEESFICSTLDIHSYEVAEESDEQYELRLEKEKKKKKTDLFKRFNESKVKYYELKTEYEEEYGETLE